MIRKRNETSFKDFLFLTISGLAALFVLAFIIINPPTKNQDIPAKAEFLLVIEWDDLVGDDIDLWARDPDKNVLSFRNDAVGIMSLEKDDLGFSNDTFTDDQGTKHLVRINREVVTLRGIQPGEYNVAAQVYSLRADTVINSTLREYRIEELSNAEISRRRIIRFTLIKINPTYTEVFSIEKPYDRRGGVVHLVNFTLTQDGEVVNIDTTPVPFIYRSVNIHQEETPSGR